MAGKKDSKKNNSKKGDYYKVSGDSIECQRQNCPKCGPGTFLGKHKDRVSCGKCGYTEFQKKRE